MAMRAREVIEAEVEELLMTWRKGCSRLGVSKVLISIPHTYQYSICLFKGYSHTFAAPQLASQFREGTHKRIIL